jgi:hypothetical protein
MEAVKWEMTPRIMDLSKERDFEQMLVRRISLLS